MQVALHNPPLRHLVDLSCAFFLSGLDSTTAKGNKDSTDTDTTTSKWETSDTGLQGNSQLDIVYTKQN